MAYQPSWQPFRLSKEDVGIPDYAKALSQGFQTAADKYKPATAASDLLTKMLQAKINTPKAEDAQGWYDLEKKYKNAMIDKANRPDAITGETAQLFRLRDSLPPGPDRDKVDQIITLKSQGNAGTTVYNPDTGEPLVQVGGPVGGGRGSKSGQGGVFSDQQGNQYTPPTGAVNTQLQNRIIGEEQVEPILKDIVENVPQFQSGWTQLQKKVEGGMNRWLGTNYDLPSKAATGKAALTKSAESMIKLYGLNATGHNVDEVKNILIPDKDESKEGYENRVRTEMRKFAASKGVAQNQVRHGIQVQSGNKSEPYSETTDVYSYKSKKWLPVPNHDVHKFMNNAGYKIGRDL